MGRLVEGGSVSMEITIKDFWTTLKRSAILMVVCALLFGVAFYVYNSRFATKIYSSSVEYILLARDGSVEDEEKLNNYLVVGVKSIPTLESVLMSDKTMKSVLDYIEGRRALEPDNSDFDLDGSYTPSGLLGCFSFTWDNPETLVFTVRCRVGSAKDARVLLYAFGEIINERSETVLHGIFTVDQCYTPGNGVKVSPNVTKNTLLGTVIGAVLSYATVLAVSILDTRVKREKDLRSRFAQIPVLGQIPRID